MLFNANCSSRNKRSLNRVNRVNCRELNIMSRIEQQISSIVFIFDSFIVTCLRIIILDSNLRMGTKFKGICNKHSCQATTFRHTNKQCRIIIKCNFRNNNIIHSRTGRDFDNTSRIVHMNRRLSNCSCRISRHGGDFQISIYNRNI